ncbi:hypothetical protein MTP99_014172 [Tenebrio molitor]|nr:hypothetical protein MTP99_014172 [Tenebrio molitor]
MNDGFTTSTHVVNRGQDICLVQIVLNSDYLLTKFNQRRWRWLKSPDWSPHQVLLVGHCIEAIPTSSGHLGTTLCGLTLSYWKMKLSEINGANGSTYLLHKLCYSLLLWEKHANRYEP